MTQFKNGRPFTAVVIDHGLPFVSGIELAAMICEIAPRQCIILASGRTRETLPDHDRALIARLGLRFLAKPFSAEELLREMPAD
jgi:DNA-binding response OmpR family regulator